MNKNTVVENLQNHVNSFRSIFDTLFENMGLFSLCLKSYLENEETLPIIEEIKGRVLQELEKQKESGKTLESVFQSHQTLKEDIINDLEILNSILEDIKGKQE